MTINKRKLRTFWDWKFKQKVEIMMIGIYCTFYLRILPDMNILQQFSWGHNWSPKFSSNMPKIVCSSSLIPYENYRELLGSVFFSVNSYEFLIENKNITFYGYKPKKQHWASSKFYWFFWKICRGTGLTSTYRISKAQR